jgi:hypothetical protein
MMPSRREVMLVSVTVAKLSPRYWFAAVEDPTNRPELHLTGHAPRRVNDTD